MAEEKAVGVQTDNTEIKSDASTAEPLQIDVKEAPAIEPVQSSVPLPEVKTEESSSNLDTTPVANQPPLASAATAESGAPKPDAPIAPEAEAEANSENVPIAHKKVIEPLNDVTQTPPNLNELLQKEGLKETASPVVVQDASLPANSVVSPGSAAPTAEQNGGSPSPAGAPGNVITPGGGSISTPGANQPSDIAL